jgi:hypothetical protein
MDKKCKLTKKQLKTLADEIYYSKRVMKSMTKAQGLLYADDSDISADTAIDIVMDSVFVVLAERGHDIEESPCGGLLSDMIIEMVDGGLT